MARQYMNLAEIYGQVDAARANQAQMENNQIQQERLRRQFSREDEQYADERAIKDIYRSAVTDVDGKPVLDEKRLISDLYQRAPEKALAVQEGFTKRDAEASKLQRENQKAELADKVERIKAAKDIIATTYDQNSYMQAQQTLRQIAPDLPMPEQWTPEWRDNSVLTGEGFLKKAEAELNRGVTMRGQDITMRGQDMTDSRTRAEGAANRGVTMRGQNLTDARAKETSAAGKAPSGYRYLSDGSLEAIKGGPADIKAGELGAKAEARKRMQLGTTANTIDAVDTALKQAGFFETGMTGAAMSKLAGSDAYNLRKTAETIKANLGFNELQAMREASPTGGALGAIAVQELTALQSTIANIDPNQSEAQLKANLKKVRNHVNKWRKTMGGEEIPEQVEKTQAPRGADVRSEADKILGL
jgi:hypothetical protein